MTFWKEVEVLSIKKVKKLLPKYFSILVLFLLLSTGSKIDSTGVGTDDDGGGKSEEMIDWWLILKFEF